MFENNAGLHRPRTIPFLRRRYGIGRLTVWLIILLSATAGAWAQDQASMPPERLAEQARAIWESGAIAPALDVLEAGLQRHPQALLLHKLRGDILAAGRGPQEAVRAYDTALAKQPAALDIRWAKWSVLLHWGQAEEALAELHRIAEIDANNPLVHLRLAQELRKLDRLDDSLASYRQAVTLAPKLLGWRLAMARARFDILDYRGADADVQYVLAHVPAGSPLKLSAKNQLAQHYESMERGRRFTPALTPGATEQQLKEWAAIRADAWKLFSTGRFQEAEPIYRRITALNPRDTLARHQLGVTLMQLGRCQEAVAIFGSVLNMNPGEEDYADTVFRMGQCLVELEQWEDAFVHFQTLYDSAVEFEENNKDVPLPAGTRVLAKDKLARWLDKIRPHVPEAAQMKAEEAAAAAAASSNEKSPATAPADDAPLEPALERLTPQNALDPQASLMGRDADFSWFRFVIPAGKVMRDDFPTGAHEFIPLNPNDTFPITQPEIYLVFRLVSASYDAIPLSAQCFQEIAEVAGGAAPIAQDQVMLAMNDQSGYFRLTAPTAGWAPGLYRCGLFAGERTSAYTQADEVRFRIVQPTPDRLKP
ncbi:MAG: tetratricopeptide repeat protein [Nitrospira sp.]|nr:tetratricopeptide repeat protein [Nitrospira sp.]